MKLCDKVGGIKDETRCKLCPLFNLSCGFYFECMKYPEIKETVKKVKKVLKSVFPHKFGRKN